MAPSRRKLLLPAVLGVCLLAVLGVFLLRVRTPVFPPSAEVDDASLPPDSARPAGVATNDAAPIFPAVPPTVPAFAKTAAPGEPAFELRAGRFAAIPPRRPLPVVHGTESPRGIPWLVQFDTPVTPAIRAALEASGAAIRAYIPTDALLVEAPASAPGFWNGIPSVRGILEYVPAFKISPELAAALADPAPRPVAIQTFAPADAETVAARLRAASAADVAAVPGRRWGIVTAELAAPAVWAAAGMPEVEWLEPRTPARVCNELAGKPEAMDYDVFLDSGTLDGAGQIIGHADTGLDSGNLATLSPDLAGRVVHAGSVTSRRTTWHDAAGHGTHTAAAILGSGALSSNLYRGAAPAASLYHQAMGPERKDTALYPPKDLYELFLPPYEAGARIHSDSWGQSGNGNYTLDAATCDEFVRDHPDMLILFATGNEGTDRDKDGVVDSGSIVPPATAKNILSVGASENLRPQVAADGLTAITYGMWLYADFRTDPILSDFPSTPWDGDDAHTGLLACSSRGPCADGRVKPDLVAPGANAISLRARGVSGLDPVAANTNYVWMSGTSMAVPRVAGAAALLRQHCAENLGIEPSAALLRAAFAGGARSLAPGQYGTGGFREIPDAYPNNAEGWGLVDVAATVAPEAPLAAVWLDAPSPLSTGETNLLRFAVTDPDLPLAAILAWSDEPAELTAAIQLVQDLDLLLVSPSGETFFPNSLDAPDRLNTIEGIRIPNAETGTWTLAVSAFNAPLAPQSYALYLRGAVQPFPRLSHDPPGILPYSPSTRSYPLYLAVTADGAGWTASAPALHYSTNGTDFLSRPLSPVEDGVFGGFLPAAPAGTTYFYYFTVPCGSETVFLPEAAAAEPFTLSIGESATLLVSATPTLLGTPVPDYGRSLRCIGETIDFSAPDNVAEFPDSLVRHACAGAVATGLDVENPVGNAFTAGIFASSASVVWQWEPECALVSATVPLSGTPYTNWHPCGATVSPPPAADSLFIDGTPHAFYAWETNGTPEPLPASPCHPPVVLSDPLRLTAAYLPADADSDANGLPDWFEYRHFGALGQDPDADPDADGYPNRDEAASHSNPLDPADIPVPPSIHFAPPADPQSTPAPWPIAATVTSRSGPVSATLFHTRPSAGLAVVPLTPVATSSYATVTFSGEFLPPVSTGETISYFLAATDSAGLNATTPTHSLSAAYPRLAIDASPLLLSLPHAGTASVLRPATNTGHAPLELSLSAAPFGFADDASPASPCTHGGTNDDWHRCDIISATTNGTAWHFATETPFSYGLDIRTPVTADAWLATPPVLLPPAGLAAPALAFRHWLDAEIGDEIVNGAIGCYDSGFLEISTDDGATWTQLAPDGGYPAGIIGHSASPFPGGTPCFASTTNADGATEWQTVTADLSPYAGQTVRIRFRYGTDRYTTTYGWFIDDIRITPLTPPAASPAAGWYAASIDTGTVPPALSLAFDASPTEPASLSATCLLLHHNAPETPTPVPIPVALANLSRRIVPLDSGPGATTPADPVVLDPGQTATFTHVPDPGAFLFTLALGADPIPLPDLLPETATTVSLPASNTTLAATFAQALDPSLADPDYLAAHGLTNQNWMTESLLDHDADGLLTWQEAQLGSDPLDPADAPLAIYRLETVPTGTLRITWHTFTNPLSYTLQHTTNLLDDASWTNVPLLLPSTHPLATTDLPPLPGAYRLAIP